MKPPPRPESFDEPIAHAEREAARTADRLAALREMRSASAKYWAATADEEPPRRGRPPILDDAVLNFLRSHPDDVFDSEGVVDGLRGMGVAQEADDPVQAMVARLGRLYRRGLIARPAPSHYRALPEEPSV